MRTGNASAERILGSPADELTGRSVHDGRWRTIHEDGSPFRSEDYPAAVTLRTGEPRASVVMGVYRPDGGRLDMNSRPLPAEGGTDRRPLSSRFPTLPSASVRKSGLPPSMRSRACWHRSRKSLKMRCRRSCRPSGRIWMGLWNFLARGSQRIAASLSGPMADPGRWGRSVPRTHLVADVQAGGRTAGPYLGEREGRLDYGCRARCEFPP